MNEIWQNRRHDGLLDLFQLDVVDALLASLTAVVTVFLAPIS